MVETVLLEFLENGPKNHESVQNQTMTEDDHNTQILGQRQSEARVKSTPMKLRSISKGNQDKIKEGLKKSTFHTHVKQSRSKSITKLDQPESSSSIMNFFNKNMSFTSGVASHSYRNSMM